MTPELAARLLARDRYLADQAEAEAARKKLPAGQVLSPDTPPGWLARKMGNSYAEDVEDVRARIWLGTKNVKLGRGYAREAFLRSMAAARERLSDLSQYRAFIRS